jgi:multidrug efflux pump subunit AcrB
MIRFALRNPHAIIVLALGTIVLGVTSFRKIPADLLPIFKTRAVQIVTFYPGMPPEVMERDIMSRLERWTGQSVGIEHQEGKAMLGVCVVKDFFHEGISLETAMSVSPGHVMRVAAPSPSRSWMLRTPSRRLGSTWRERSSASTSARPGSWPRRES